MKKKIVLCSVLLVSNVFAYCQHTEYRVTIGSGLFHVNSDVVQEPYYSSINTQMLSSARHEGYVNQPWGPHSGFSYGVGFEMKKITAHHFLWGLEASFESLQSKKAIHWIFDNTLTYYPATGESTLRNSYITLFPSFGYRFKLIDVYMDIMGGADLAVSPILPHEKATATVTATNQVVTCDVSSRNYPGSAPVDFRWRMQVALSYKKWGLTSGYSWGLYNQEGQTATQHSYARYLRFAVSYKIR